MSFISDVGERISELFIIKYLHALPDTIIDLNHLNWYTDTLRINILNPKAMKLLKDLADMNIISIQDNSKNGFEDILKRLRAKKDVAPTLEEITQEVEAVRNKRYGK